VTSELVCKPKVLNNGAEIDPVLLHNVSLNAILVLSFLCAKVECFLLYVSGIRQRQRPTNRQVTCMYYVIWVPSMCSICNYW